MGGLAKDDKQALAWFQKAADGGDARAMRDLGLSYDQPRHGLKKDDVQAVFWYRRAASAGDRIAMTNLGWMYQNGRGGLRQDDVQAVVWFRKASALGEPHAMINLAGMYEQGGEAFPKTIGRPLFGVKKPLQEAGKNAYVTLIVTELLGEDTSPLVSVVITYTL